MNALARSSGHGTSSEAKVKNGNLNVDVEFNYLKAGVVNFGEKSNREQFGKSF